MTYKPYSRELWDYLGDMPYMPSRADREKLTGGDSRRIQIWDYFFRINPNDVGKPQREETQKIRTALEKEMETHAAQKRDLENESKNLVPQRNAKITRPAILTTILGLIAALIIIPMRGSLGFALIVTSPLWIGAIISSFKILNAILFERNRRTYLTYQIADLRALEKSQIKSVRSRIADLGAEIEALEAQIPAPPSDEQIRAWLEEDLLLLREISFEQTGLSPDRLIRPGQTESGDQPWLRENPIPVMGPGELQDPIQIEQNFLNVPNRELSKHLTARRAHITTSGLIDVIFGVYFINYIAVTEDMLATYSMFYDFITVLPSAEQITEQYYQDVIAITTTREPRQIQLSSYVKNSKDGGNHTVIEDAPTFTISLSNNEVRSVTFVNENYFMRIRDRLDLRAADIPKIYWIQDAKQVAENAVQSLRFYMRKHKGGPVQTPDL